MKKAVIACVGIFLLSVLPAHAGTLKQVSPSSYDSNGAPIMGWNWLRQPGHYAQWSFTCPAELRSGRSAVAVFCFSTLSTDRVNGGAGYNSSLKVCMNGRQCKKITFQNDCPCLKRLKRYYSGNSHGIGYPSHGCALYKITCNPLQPILIRASFVKGAHTAVKKDSLKMIYVSP